MHYVKISQFDLVHSVIACREIIYVHNTLQLLRKTNFSLSPETDQLIYLPVNKHQSISSNVR